MPAHSSFFQRILLAVENGNSGFGLFFFAFLTLIIARLTIENILGGLETHDLSFFFSEFSHTFLFFSLSFLLFLPILSFFARVNTRKAGYILLFGFLIILSPPILDAWISGGSGYWSFYAFDSLSGLWHRFWFFFGNRPHIGITYGVRIEVALAVLAFGSYVFLKTRSGLRSVAASFVSYVIFFFLGTLPSWLSFLFFFPQKSLGSINELDIAALFLPPPTLFNQHSFDFPSALNVKMSLILGPIVAMIFAFFLFAKNKKSFVAFVRNIRPVQIAYHIGLFFSGIAAAFLLVNPSVSGNIFEAFGILNLLIAISCAWIASAVVNDIFDQKTDRISNAERPLPKGDLSVSHSIALGKSFFAASLFFSALVSMKAALMLLAYQAIAWLYSAPPFRLKRLPLIATLFSALASILVLLLGFILVSPQQNLSGFPLPVFLLLLFSLTVSLPIKDFKDKAGDAADGVFTIPVLFGEHKAKLLIGSGIFLSYIASVRVFHEPKLLFGALLCGSLSFWILFFSQKNARNSSYRKLPLILLVIVFLYLLFLGAFLF